MRRLEPARARATLRSRGGRGGLGVLLGALLGALLGTAGAAPEALEPPTPAAASPIPQHIMCATAAEAVALGSAQWNGWGRDLANSRYQPEPALRASDVPRLALKWAFGYPGSGVSGQPTVVDGRVFVAAPTGRVYSLDARSGCIYWSYEVGTGVRTAMLIGESAPPQSAPRPRKLRHKRIAAHLELRKAPSTLYFGDDRGTVYALDAEHGTLLWKSAVETHPLTLLQAAPVLFKDRLFVATASSEPAAVRDASYACCTFRGAVVALDAQSGQTLWKTYMVSSEPHALKLEDAASGFGPAGVPILAAPTIDVDRGLLYVVTGRAFAAVDQPLANAIVALDLKDGAVRWAKQPGPRGGDAGEFIASPVLRVGAGGQRMLIAAQHSGVVYSLDPDRQGEILWQVQLMAGKHEGAVEWGVAADHHALYVALSAAQLPQDPGGLVALDLKSGARRWQVEAPREPCAWGSEGCLHGQAQAITVIPGIAFCGDLDGHLRAYSTIDGKVLWDTETARDFHTVNGLTAHGGSLDEGGATIVNGVLYVNSGYGRRGDHAGNVLLAYSIDGK